MASAPTRTSQSALLTALLKGEPFAPISERGEGK